MNEKQIAKVLIEELLKLGFVVHRYNAVTTNSIYLKLDFGVCCGIRIADHSGKKKYHYRFNVVKNYGEDIKEEEAVALQEKLATKYPDCEVTAIYGGQPVYYYIISIE